MQGHNQCVSASTEAFFCILQHKSNRRLCFRESPGGTTPNVAHSGSCGDASSQPTEPRRGGTRCEISVPPRGDLSLAPPAPPQLPLWATFGAVPPGLREKRGCDTRAGIARGGSISSSSHLCKMQNLLKVSTGNTHQEVSTTFIKNA